MIIRLHLIYQIYCQHFINYTRSIIHGTTDLENLHFLGILEVVFEPLQVRDLLFNSDVRVPLKSHAHNLHEVPHRPRRRAPVLNVVLEEDVLVEGLQLKGINCVANGSHKQYFHQVHPPRRVRCPARYRWEIAT